MTLDDQCRKARTARGIGRSLEQRLDVRRDTQDQRVRIAAQLNETRPIKPPSKPFGLVGTKPEDREPPADGPERQHGRETRRAGRILATCGEQLMHPAADETAAQRFIKGGIAGCDPPVPGQQPPPGN